MEKEAQVRGGLIRGGGARVRGAWSGREKLLNADGEFLCIFHPLPHQVGPVRAVDEDALGSCSLHGTRIPAGTHLS